MAEAWKQHEKRTATALHGRRLGATGQANPDVISDDGRLVAECKHRAELPHWLTTALAKVRTQAGPRRLGLVVLHAKGARDSLVVLSLRDWIDWYGDVPGVAEDGEGEGASDE